MIRNHIALLRFAGNVGAMPVYEFKVAIDPATVVIADEALLERSAEHWSVVEDIILRQAWVIGVWPEESTAQREWAALEPALVTAGVVFAGAPVCRVLGDTEWRESYKAHFKPWQFGRLHWVPVWEREKFALPPGDAVLWLDPGLAFGTGNHETTRLCVERLVTLAEEHGARGRVVDAGCGSGILALSAALLGYPDVAGFDNDPEAVRISQENAAQNGLEERVRFFVGDLKTGLADQTGKVDVLLANIQADVLMRFAPELVAAVAPGGTLVLSGILAGENAQVRTCFEAHTPQWTINARVMGEWSDVVLQRPR